MEEIFLAFMDIAELEKGAALRGGCLVTDIETKPLEFRCTASIRPTELQRVLYGNKLMEHICKDLVGLPMLKALTINPNLVVVRNSEFLKIRPLSKMPVLLVESSSTGGIRGLRAHHGFGEEAQFAISILKKLGSQEDILEPFHRVRNALEEAHKQNIGDKAKNE